MRRHATGHKQQPSLRWRWCFGFGPHAHAALCCCCRLRRGYIRQDGCRIQEDGGCLFCSASTALCSSRSSITFSCMPSVLSAKTHNVCSYLQKKSQENINSRLQLVMKSGKYTLGYKTCLKTLRSGKGELQGAVGAAVTTENLSSTCIKGSKGSRQLAAENGIELHGSVVFSAACAWLAWFEACVAWRGWPVY